MSAVRFYGKCVSLLPDQPLSPDGERGALFEFPDGSRKVVWGLDDLAPFLSPTFFDRQAHPETADPK
jgi:hypothetical protein